MLALCNRTEELSGNIDKYLILLELCDSNPSSREFWSYCILTIGYLINRTPSMILKGKSPFEMLYDRLPLMNHLRIFGYLCYVHNQHHGGDKFASRSKRSVFLGYPFGKKRWKVYDLDTGMILVSRDVVFVETEFPFALIKENTLLHLIL